MPSNMTPQQYAQKRADEKRAQDYYQMLELNEGNKPQVYKDTKGNRTIGIGFNLEDASNRRFLKEQGIDINELTAGRKLTERETKILYNHSLTKAYKDAMKYDKGFSRRPENVKKALVDMSFNLGLTKLNEFKKMKEALQKNDYATAADEAKDSNWFKQVKTRGPRTVELIRSAAR